MVGGHAVEICSEDSSVLASIRTQLEHLATHMAPVYRLQIALANDQVEIPLEVSNRFTSDSYDAFIDFHSGAVIISSLGRHETIALIKTSRFSYARPDMLRMLLQVVAGKTTFALHGGGIAWDLKQGILVTAKGGSGKSTAVAATVAGGAKTIGDDFILGRFSDDGTSLEGWSLFSSVRLESSSPARGLFGDSDYPKHESKEIFNLDKQFPGCVEEVMEISKIVIPSFSSNNFVESISNREALLAILPSSVGLSINRADALAKISEMVKKLPTFKVGLTRDIRQNSQFLKELASS